MNPLHPTSAQRPSRTGLRGEVPEFWKTVRLRGVVKNVVELTDDSSADEIYVALEHVESWTGKFVFSRDAVTGTVKRFRAGDVLFGKLRPYLAKVACPGRRGVCVGEFLVLRPKIASLSARFLEQVLRSKPVVDEIDASTFGARMPRAEWQFIGNMRFLLPSVTEQRAIVRFLHHADRRIQRYIRAKQKLLALLEEQKQAIIHLAVTGQIDVRTGQPYQAYKPSGVEWLGEVPEHWEVRRLKTICSMKSGEGITAESIESVGEYPVYGGNGIRGYTSNYTHDGEFVLIGRQGALCGNIHLACGQFWASEHAVVATINPGFVLKWFSAILHVMNLNQYSIAAAQPGLAVERVMNLWLPVPPPKEQAAVALYLDEVAAIVDYAAAPARSKIDLVREYRTRLIADLVTGKLDVREAAAGLPEDGVAGDEEGSKEDQMIDHSTM